MCPGAWVGLPEGPKSWSNQRPVPHTKRLDPPLEGEPARGGARPTQLAAPTAPGDVMLNRARARIGTVLRGKWRIDRVLGIGGISKP